MADFVLDENCYIRALYAQRTDRHADWLASRLLQLLQTEHRWILSWPILRAYLRQIKKHGSDDRSFNEMALKRSLHNVQRDMARCHWPADLRPVPGDYDHKDDHMVESAAAMRGSLLITLDDKLAAALIREDIPIRYGFSVLDVSAAWQLLRPQSSL
jgi:hypothetical protein